MARGKKTGGRDFSSTNQPKKRGRKPLPKDLRDARNLTKARLQGMLNKSLWCTQDELTARMKDDETPMIEKMIGSIVYKALVEGDQTRLTFILDRMIGKVKEEIDIKTYSQKLEGLSDQEIVEVGKDAIKLLKVVE